MRRDTVEADKHLAMLLRSEFLGPKFTKVFRCLAGIGDGKIDGVEEADLIQLQRLDLARKDFDVLGKRDVMILTNKGKRVAKHLKGHGQ